MKEMTASDASRGFSALLDLVEQGESIVVTRAGRRVAVIKPAPTANGSQLQKLFDRWRRSEALDKELLENVRAAVEAVSEEEDADPWRE